MNFSHQIYVKIQWDNPKRSKKKTKLLRFINSRHHFNNIKYTNDTVLIANSGNWKNSQTRQSEKARRKDYISIVKKKKMECMVISKRDSPRYEFQAGAEI